MDPLQSNMVFRLRVIASKTPIILRAWRNREVIISLEGNMTTGYSWKPYFDSQALELVKRDFKPYHPELLGSPGKELFFFKPLRREK